MKCYFLNVRTFLSKSGKSCYMITIANCDGEVSEFFISKELYDFVSSSFSPFDYVEVSIVVARGHVSLSGINRIDTAEHAQ